MTTETNSGATPGATPNGTAPERVVARIRKLIALAQDAGATDGERDNAMRMAHATLAKYNLDLAALDDAAQDKEEPRVREADVFDGRPWARQICHAIAHLNFCYYFYSGKGHLARHSFVGRHSNAVTAKEISQFVVAAVLSESRKVARVHGGAAQRSFGLGAANKIRQRCNELRKAAEQASQPNSAPGTALVLASVYKRELAANEAYIADVLKIKFGNGRTTRSASDALAYGAGQAYGATVSLQRQVGNGHGAPAGQRKLTKE